MHTEVSSGEISEGSDDEGEERMDEYRIPWMAHASSHVCFQEKGVYYDT